MQYLTRAMIVAILNRLPDRFDAHQVERRALRLHAAAFAEDLLRFQTSPDPLQQFSAAFARWVDTSFRGQIRKTRKVRSANLGGEESSNQEWEKTSSAPII